MPNARMYWLHALSATHVGAGRGIGYIDLPLHRDKVTNWPLIPGSAFNLLEINFETGPNPGKVTHSNAVLVKK